MTKLIVRELDPNAKGSFAQLRKALALQRRISKNDPTAVEEMIDFMLQYASTDDGTDVSAVLEELSIAEFLLCAQHFTKLSGETIPNSNTPS